MEQNQPVISPERSSEERVRAILDELAALYPDARCELNHSSPFELLVATILSAQSTDARVNMVTERLFRKYNTPEDFASLRPDDLAEEIKELGLYRNKARHIVEAARRIVEEHDGRVPSEREALEALPGVGRKTANVILSNAFGIPALAVDTHVFRVSRRLGLASGKTPEQVERELMNRIPRREWTITHHRLIYHGRRMCHARRPDCASCPLRPYCAYAGGSTAGDPAEGLSAAGD